MVFTQGLQHQTETYLPVEPVKTVQGPEAHPAKIHPVGLSGLPMQVLEGRGKIITVAPASPSVITP